MHDKNDDAKDGKRGPKTWLIEMQNTVFYNAFYGLLENGGYSVKI